MVVQLARQLTKVTVIGAASRTDSASWAREMGAHHVVDHRDLVKEVNRVAPGGVDYVFTPFSAGNIESFAELLRPRGAVVAIDDPPDLNLLPLKSKSVTWHWELMFTRPLYEPESSYQHELLERVAELVEAGTIRTTLKVFGRVDGGDCRSGASDGRILENDREGCDRQLAEDFLVMIGHSAWAPAKRSTASYSTSTSRALTLQRHRPSMGTRHNLEAERAGNPWL
jgi:Zinc-binding dehydrogenase